MEESGLYLIYIEPIGVNSQDLFEYEFLFSETPDIVWAEDWAEQCPAACENMRPSSEWVAKTKRLTTIIPLNVAQKNACFSMQDCIDGIIALAWEDISEYTEYPEPSRLVFSFGETIESVEDKLAMRSQFFPVSEDNQNSDS